MTAEELKNVEYYASYFFSPEQIVIICQLKGPAQHQEDFKTAYKRGRLLKEAQLRKSIIDLAVSGSSPAQLLAVQILKNSMLDDIDI